MPTGNKAQEDSIILRGYGLAKQVQDEGAASGILKPGEILIESAADTFTVSGATAVGQKYIALENPSNDNTVPATFADTTQDYASGDNLVYVPLQKGVKYTMWLADGETTAINSALATTAAGTLVVITPDATTVVGTIVGYAKEVVAASGAVEKLKVIGA